MSKNEVHFFATLNDFKDGLLELETKRPLKYVKNVSVDVLPHIIYNSFVDIPHLGLNFSGDHQTDSYLIMDKDEELIVQEIPQVSGGVKYFVNHNQNPNSIVFWPGGYYEDIAIIAGHINTISVEKKSRELLRLFSKSVTKDFRKVGRYLIGPEALEESIRRRMITISINQPEEYDLKI